MMRLVALATASAAVVSVAHRPWGPGWIAWIALMPLLLALTGERRVWRGALAGWIASLGTGLVAFEGVAAAEPWAYPALAAFAGIPWAVVGAGFVLLARRLGTTAASWCFPLLIVMAEFVPAQRALFGDFANGMSALGYSQFDTFLLTAAGWSGVGGVSLVVAGLNVAAFLLVRERRLPPLVVVGAVAAGVAWVPPPGADGSRPGEALDVAVVQGAVSSVDSLMARFDRQAARRMVAPYQDLTAQAAERGADLVLWGETALPQAVRPGHVPDYVADALGPAPVALVGGVSYVGGDSYNSVFHWRDGELTEVYRKRALVAFNEWHYTRGEALPPLGVNGVPIGLGICLDSVYGSLARESVRAGAEMLVYLTEDSFAGRTVTPELHLRVTAFRAAETGRWAVFANQSGPSAVVDRRGRVVERIPHGEAAGAVVTIPAHAGITPYVRLGDWVGLASTLASVVLIAYVLTMGRPGPVVAGPPGAGGAPSRGEATAPDRAGGLDT